MTRHHRNRLWRSALAASAAFTVIAGVAGAAPVEGKAESSPKLRLIAASNTVTLDRWEGEGESGVYLDLGTYVTAEGGPLEFNVTRKSFKDPVVAKQIIREGKKTRTRALPAGLVKDFSGLSGFIQITLTDASGKRVVNRTETFCPNNASGRVRPDAPAKSKYPESCPTNPFTLGSVWGVENGWASNTYAGYYSNPVDVPAGEYTAKVSVTKRYRDLFNLPNEPKTLKVSVREREPEGEGAPASAHGSHGSMASGHSGHGAGAPGQATGHAYHEGRGADAPAPPALPYALKAGRMAHLGDGPGHTDGSRIAPALKPNAKRPVGRASVPNVPKPDLRSLPAWDIGISDGEDGDVPGKDYMVFSANVWNAGPAPLVVDGFRSPGKDLMDAYQYFYDAKGKQVGYSPTGTMEWDPRVGHEHWHFTDFASYRLLRANQKEIVRSGKEAFCLANTDAIDYTVKNANWHPNNTGLSTACGQQSSLSVREVLDVGSGDTYTQYRPGQSFDVTDLPNGTYYIQVIANPEKRLHETNLNNNVALRKVVLSGTKGARKVTVPAHDLINTP
ncbi:lysyl oxidase family protein [Streptomyces lunaelactis]|uniref:lysyl oxidase family protein n=1 Tax=Streptomyces lunaelactis TaxID=1535768 RepID=UPI0015849DC0|nr:lysyl oxidase family protein [Streptomyces lunaelactis]NUL23711.1 protein-lysine 6-oxidase [Streptomyces lunaelactis]